MTGRTVPPSEPGVSYAQLDLGELQANVPKQLRELRVWLFWKSVSGEDGEKPKKIPYHVSGGVVRGDFDSEANRALLVTFEEAVAKFNPRKYAGISVALGPAQVDDTTFVLSGIDLDHCADEEGIAPKAKQIIDAAASYSEISPSQTGVKIFGLGDIGRDTSTPGLEIYSCDRHFTVTGMRVSPSNALGDLGRAAELARSLLSNATREPGTRRLNGAKIDVTNRGSGNRDNAAFAFACKLRQMAIPEESAWVMLQEYNKTLQPPLGERQLREKHRSAKRYLPGPGVVNDWANVHEDIREELRNLPPAALVLPNDYVPATVSAEIIFTRLGARRELFIRGGRVVELDKGRDGIQSLSVISAEELRSRLNRHGRIAKHVVKYGKGLVLVHRHASRDNAAVLLATLEARELLPPIELVTHSAVLVEEHGQLLELGPGYHEQGGGVLVTGRTSPETVPLVEAVAALRALLVDFRFTTPADESRAIAGFIGPALRMGALVEGHALVNAVEANSSQAGKGFLTALQAAVFGEVAYPIAQREGGVGSLDESFARALESGQPFALLDNLRGRIASAYVESTITSHHGVAVRLPHKGEVVVDPRRVTFQLTSNGIETTVDFGNRMAITHLLKQPAGYKFRCFAEGDVLAHVRARQGYYLGCVFAVVRAWFEAGRPMTETHHTFRQWTGALDWIVQELFGLPPLLDGHDGLIERVANPALTWLRHIALAIVEQQRTAVELSASALAEVADEIGAAIPGVRSEEEGDRARGVGRMLARCFGALDEVLVDNVRVRRIVVQEHNAGRQEFRDVKRYLFLVPGQGAEVDE